MGPDDGSSHVPPSALLSQPNYSSLEPNTCSDRKTAVDVIPDHLKNLQQNDLSTLQILSIFRMDIGSILSKRHFITLASSVPIHRTLYKSPRTEKAEVEKQVNVLLAQGFDNPACHARGGKAQVPYTRVHRLQETGRNPGFRPLTYSPLDDVLGC